MMIEKKEYRILFAEWKKKLEEATKGPVTFLFRFNPDADMTLLPFKPDIEKWSSFPSGEYYVVKERPGAKGLNPGSPEYQFNVDFVSKFSLKQLSGCCGVVVLYHAAVYGKFQHLGLGTLLNRMRLEWARSMGYGVALCTDVTNPDHADYEQKILKKNGWSDLYSFKNPRTENKVTMSVINLLE
jgi:hypothetical protein